MIFRFNNKPRGYGFGAGMPGVSPGRRGTISNGNWDRDRKPNRGDCDPLDWRKQDGGQPFRRKSPDLTAESLVEEAEGLDFDEKTDFFISKMGRGELRRRR